MDMRRWRRIAAGIALGGLVLGICLPAATLASAARAREAAAQANIAAAETESADDPEEPSGTASLPENGLVVAITGPAGTALTLTGSGDTPLAVVQLDADGCGETPALSPGTYAVVLNDGSRSAFSLRENGSLAVQEADDLLWTNGEILYLTTQPTGSITVTKRLQGQLDGLDAAFLFQLEDAAGQTWQQALGFYDELEAEGGWYTLSATFYGLPAGTYTLTETALQPCETTASMDGSTVTLPAQVTLGEGQWTAEIVSESSLP